jgi:hypothetical protein
MKMKFTRLLALLAITVLLIGAVLASPPGETYESAGTTITAKSDTPTTETTAATTFNLSAKARALESIESREAPDLASGCRKEAVIRSVNAAPNMRRGFRIPYNWLRTHVYGLPPGNSSLHLILTSNLAASRARPEIVRVI